MSTRNLLPRLAALEKLILQARGRIKTAEQRLRGWQGIAEATPDRADAAQLIARRAIAKAQATLEHEHFRLGQLFRARATARRASPTAARFHAEAPPPPPPPPPRPAWTVPREGRDG